MSFSHLDHPEPPLHKMTQAQFDELYAEYIMEHAPGDRIIANGDMLIEAMESGYLLADFQESLGINEEADWYEELNRGYAKDRA